MDKSESNSKANVYQKSRYHTDPVYREKKKEAARSFARKKNNITPVRSMATDRISAYEEYAQERDVVDGHTEKKLLSVNTEELAELLGGYNPVSIYRWQAEGFLPKPVILAYNSTPGHCVKPEKVYSREEAITIANILGEEQRKLLRIRLNKPGLRETIFEQVALTRKEQGIYGCKDRTGFSRKRAAKHSRIWA